MPRAITRDLGAFVAGLTFADLPAEAIRVAKLAFFDTIGVMIAGRSNGAPQTLLLALDPPAGDATVLFTARRAHPGDAACVGGTAAHALDYDDVAMRGHPSCVIVPAILAEAEHLGASGERMIAAYVAAYETWAELILRDPDQQQLRGWHLTGWVGAIAAAAACANLRGLDSDRTAMALAIAASESAGLMANIGTFTKPLHAGRAAQGGLMAARLAERGFTASPDALESPTGWLQAVSAHGRVDLDRPVAAGAPWQITQVGLCIRRHSVCYVGHRLVDGMLDILDAHALAPDEVVEIRASVARPMADILRYDRPTDAGQAKFSAPFALAATLLKGAITPGDLTDAFVLSAPVQSLMSRIVVELREPDPTIFDQVTVRTRDGRELASGPVTVILGSPERPLSAAQVADKFADCLRFGAPDATTPAFIAALIDRLTTLEQLPDARDLRAFAC